ncbi:MAG: histone deacetylase [Candidatus Lokiarchaeota archaeon]|nr:histone deacetylase [Candidatus Lokiarchaeota archaeon]
MKTCDIQTGIAMVTKIVYDEIFKLHEMAPGHPENPLRLEAALEGIREINTIEGEIGFLKPKRAELEDIYKIHDKKYIEHVKDQSEKGGGFFTLDTTSNEHTYLASLFAAGGGVLAVNEIVRNSVKNALVLCRPPGHHAEFGRAFGFCFVNNIAIAAKYLIDTTDCNRVMIIDYDAHHGNGTQNAFYSTNDVMYIGLHQDGRTLFPGTGFVGEIGEGDGKGYNINIPMIPTAGDWAYGIAFDEVIQPIAESYNPDFILVSSGFDCHYQDPLAQLGLTYQGIININQRLIDIAEKIASGRIAFFLEGGYNLGVIKQASKHLVEQLAGIPIEKIPEQHHKENKHEENIQLIIQELKKQLTELCF